MSISSATIDERDIRAARESMTAVSESPGLFTVYSGETSRYLVGIREIPDLPGRTDVELMINARTHAGQQEGSG